MSHERFDEITILSCRFKESNFPPSIKFVNFLFFVIKLLKKQKTLERNNNTSTLTLY